MKTILGRLPVQLMFQLKGAVVCSVDKVSMFLDQKVSEQYPSHHVSGHCNKLFAHRLRPMHCMRQICSSLTDTFLKTSDQTQKYYQSPSLVNYRKCSRHTSKGNQHSHRSKASHP